RLCSASQLRPPISTLFPYTNALPISIGCGPGDRAPYRRRAGPAPRRSSACHASQLGGLLRLSQRTPPAARQQDRGHHHGGLAVLDRKSTRLNSSHVSISYAVFCLKTK